jgi:hypothetical protein
MKAVDVVKILCDIAVALGTIAVIVVAIWGDWWRALLAAPQITIEPIRNFEPEIRETTSGRKLAFYYLNIKNSRHWSPARGVRVLLKRFERRDANNHFHAEPVTAMFQFCWSPSESSEVVQTIVDERICDLGFLWEPELSGHCHFEPKLYSEPLSKPFKVNRAQAVRYHLLPVGENFRCDEPTVIEIEWDGEYSEDLMALERHLQIRVV